MKLVRPQTFEGLLLGIAAILATLTGVAALSSLRLCAEAMAAAAVKLAAGAVVFRLFR